MENETTKKLDPLADVKSVRGDLLDVVEQEIDSETRKLEQEADSAN